MSPLSLITKLQTVFDLITSKNLYLMILALIVILTIIFITTNGSNRKQSKKTYILLYLAGFIFIVFQYGSSFMTLLDYAINEVFITYYFPNIVIYLLMLIITNVVLFKTIFSNKADFKLKVINSSAFAIIMYLFILAISQVNSLDLDVFNITELYSSNAVRSLLELSMFIFVFWMVVLGIYYLIRKYQYKHNLIQVESFTNYNIIHDFDIKEAYKVPKKPLVIEEPKEEKKEEQPSLDLLGQNFTLDEYKLMVKILKEEKDKTQEEQELKVVEDNPLTELNKLYQSIRD
jgi:membrane protein